MTEQTNQSEKSAASRPQGNGAGQQSKNQAALENTMTNSAKLLQGVSEAAAQGSEEGRQTLLRVTGEVGQRVLRLYSIAAQENLQFCSDILNSADVAGRNTLRFATDLIEAKTAAEAFQAAAGHARRQFEDSIEQSQKLCASMQELINKMAEPMRQQAAE